MSKNTTVNSLKWFKRIVTFIAVIPLLTGMGDMVSSVASQIPFGMPETDAVTDPVLNSTFRFWAALWFGVGIFFLLFIRDLPKYYEALMLLFCIVFIGGLGRIASVIQFGMPDTSMGLTLVVVAITLEVIIMPLLAWWLIRLKKTFQPVY